MNLQEILNSNDFTSREKDILDYLDIEYTTDRQSFRKISEFVSNLPRGNYFVSDLDWTFFRGFLIQEAFNEFIKYVRNIDIRKLDTELYGQFIRDLGVFYQLKKQAFNKQISFQTYLDIWLFMIINYQNLVDWNMFLHHLKERFAIKNLVNPYLFSLQKLKEVVKKGDYFLFVSGGSDFVFNIYLEELKKYLRQQFGLNVNWNLFGISSIVDFEQRRSSCLWKKNCKDSFLKFLKSQRPDITLIWWMWDTNSDFGIAQNLDQKEFWFINPARNVFDQIEKFKDIKFHFIFEDKDSIFEMPIRNIKLLNINL